MFFRSRMDRFRDSAIERATEGKMGMSYLLFKSEMKKLENMGFEVHATAKSSNGELLCSVNWDEAFKETRLSSEQSFYAFGASEQIPETENFAQTLYLLATRKS